MIDADNCNKQKNKKLNNENQTKTEKKNFMKKPQYSNISKNNNLHSASLFDNLPPMGETPKPLPQHSKSKNIKSNTSIISKTYLSFQSKISRKLKSNKKKHNRNISKRANDSSSNSSSNPSGARLKKPSNLNNLKHYFQLTLKRIISDLKFIIPIMRTQKKENLLIYEQISQVIDDHVRSNNNFPPKSEVSLMKKIIAIDKKNIEDIMVQRSDIISVDLSAPVKDIVDIMDNKECSKLPVYKDNLDNIVGMINERNLLKALIRKEKFTISDIMLPVNFVPPSMKITDLPASMNNAGNDMVIVVDEYGATGGLVTANDIFQELFGDIDQEREKEKLLVKMDDGSYNASARVEIEELERFMGLPSGSFASNEDEYDTLGGLIFSIVERVPGCGEIIKYNNYIEFEIIDATMRCINNVKIVNNGKSNVNRLRN